MKVVIVNDCAHVLEDLIPHLLKLFNFDIQVIQRTRGLWSKTFGIASKILKAKGQGCVYHTNYALQDAYLVDKFKHLDILHCHGSDVRWTVHSKKWGWMVRHNLKSAKTVLYATPDLEEDVKSYRQDAVYLPTPVKTEVFVPKKNCLDNPKAVYFKLRYESLPDELEKCLLKRGIAFEALKSNIRYDEMPETLQRFDIFIDRFTIPSFSKTCLEAMSCGLATIDYRHVNVMSQRAKELSDIETIEEIGLSNRRFVEESHNVVKVAKQLGDVWKELC